MRSKKGEGRREGGGKKLDEDEMVKEKKSCKKLILSLSLRRKRSNLDPALLSTEIKVKEGLKEQ